MKLLFVPVIAQLNGVYGQSDIYTNVPTIIGKNGVEGIIELNLSEDEMITFQHSCDVLRNHIQTI